MGICSSPPPIDNDAELFFRDVLSNFPKMSYASFKTNFQNPENQIIYNRQRNTLVMNTKYIFINLDLIPCWNEVWGLTYEDININLIMWQFCFNKEKNENKYEILQELSIKCNNPLTIIFFKDFLSRYLKLSLIFLNKMYVKSIEKYKNSTIESITITTEMIKQAEHTFSILISFIDQFIGFVELKVNKAVINNVEELHSDDLDFSKEMFIEFVTETDIFDLVKLRSLFYDFSFREKV